MKLTEADRYLDALRTAVASRAGQSDLACVPVPLAQLRAALRALDERTHGVWCAAVDMVDDARVAAWQGDGAEDVVQRRHDGSVIEVPVDRWRALVDAVAAARGRQ